MSQQHAPKYEERASRRPARKNAAIPQSVHAAARIMGWIFRGSTPQVVVKSFSAPASQSLVSCAARPHAVLRFRDDEAVDFDTGPRPGFGLEAFGLYNCQFSLD
ncbi:hypothetical protein PG987_000109 [Apiospora arundinis]